MILSSLSQAERYASLHPLFPRVFEEIRHTDFLQWHPVVTI